MKTLVIIVDGMRPDAIADHPIAKKIMEKSAYTLNARTVMPSVTLPCHMSLFHSVDPTRHGTTTNTYMPQVRPINGICETLFNAGKTCTDNIDLHHSLVSFFVFTRLLQSEFIQYFLPFIPLII